MDEEYYHELKPIDTPNISINLDDVDSLIFLSGVTRFYYTANTSGLKLLEVQIFVDDSLYHSKKEYDGFFDLNGDKFSDGVHELKILLTAKRGNGSLADLFDKDGYTIERNWKFWVDNRLPVAVEITDIRNDNGILRIEWQKYEAYNFLSYTLVRRVLNGSGGYYSSEIAQRDQASSNFAHDSSYFGGTTSYYVMVTTRKNQSASSPLRHYADDSCHIAATWIQGTWIQVSWNKIKYPGAVKSLKLFPHSNQPPVLINSFDSVTFTGDIGVVGELNQIRLEITGFSPEIEKTVCKTTIALGEPSFKFVKFMPNQVNDDLMLTDFTKLFRYSTGNNQVMNSMNLPNGNSPYIYSPSDDVMLCSSPNRVLDPHTFTFTTMLIYAFRSDNLSLTSYGIVSNNTGSYLYDFRNMMALYHLDLPYYSNSTITYDNRYLLLRTGSYSNQLKCYDILFGKCTLLWTAEVNNFLLIPGDPGRMLVHDQARLIVKDIPSYNTISSFEVPTGTMLEVNSGMKHVSFRVYNGTMFPYYQVYQYETGELVLSLNAYSGSISMFNGWLYNSEGYKLQIPVK